MSKLKIAREAAGLSQSQLAKVADVNFRAYQEIEAGRRSIDGTKLKTLLKICIALNCRLEEVLEDEETIELVEKYMYI